MSAAAGADPMLPRPYRVAASRRETGDTVTLELVPVGGAAPGFAPDRFKPGQFNMLYAFGIGEVPISLSGDPADGGRVVHTVRAVGAVSRAIAQAGPGSVLGLRGPFGSAWPMAEAEGRDLLLIAGGLGLAPLRPAIYHALAHSEHYGRIAILYGSRGPAEILYRDELARWRQRSGVTVAVTVDHADAAWDGHVGVVPDLIRGVSFDPANSVAMICGPEVMFRFTARALLGAGVPAGRIHVSMERDMKCAVGLCGHCQFGADFICRDGAVLRYDRVAARLAVREV